MKIASTRPPRIPRPYRPRVAAGVTESCDIRRGPSRPATYDAGMKVEPTVYGDRKVYTVAGFHRGVAECLHGRAAPVHPARPRVAPAPAGALGRRGGDRASPPGRLADGLLHAQGPGERRLP